MSKRSKRQARHHANQKYRQVMRDEKRKPDLEIELKGNAPKETQRLKNILEEAEKAGVTTIVKSYDKDGNTIQTAVVEPQERQKHPGGTATVDREKQVAQSWKYPDGIDPNYVTNSNDTHSIGIRPHPHNHAIAKSLLNIAGYKSHAGPLTPPLEHDDRPLIDLLHEATFDPHTPGLKYIKDFYELRMLLRKAHCFTLDSATSALVADFSVAIASDLEATRQMAIPPFPVTWIDWNNIARLKRMRELGVAITPTAAGILAGPPVDRCGWLIQANNDQYFVTYVTNVEQGVIVAPVSFWWHTREPYSPLPSHTVDPLLQQLAFGVANCNVNPADAYPAISPIHFDFRSDKKYAVEIQELMRELMGELRHVWGFLVALGAGHLGASAQYTSQAAPTRSPPIMKNGKPLLPLEHKVLHLHLNKKPPAKLIAQAITHHHNRRHDVRAHSRQLKSGKRIPVKSHQRGDEKLGRIEKTYRVER